MEDRKGRCQKNVYVNIYGTNLKGLTEFKSLVIQLFNAKYN